MSPVLPGRFITTDCLGSPTFSSLTNLFLHFSLPWSDLSFPWENMVGVKVGARRQCELVGTALQAALPASGKTESEWFGSYRNA